MSEIGSRPYPEPWGEVQKLVAEPVWLGVSEVELADLAQTLRAVADLERASGDEIHSHAGRLEDNHAGGGLDVGPEALRRDSAALHVHAERCERAAAILDEAALESREAKVDLSVLGAYAQSEQESWDVLLKQTANSRWVQKLAAKSLAKAQAAAKARADKAETFFAAKIREHDKLHEEEIVVGRVDLDEVDGPAAQPARNAAVEPQPEVAARPAEAQWREAADAGAFEHHNNAWPPQHEGRPSVDPAAATSAQSGSAVLEHDTSPAATEAQSADLAVPGEVVDVDLAEQADTATMGAAGSMTGQAFNLANAEEQYRSPGARGYHGDEGFFGDRRDGALAQDPKSRLARLAQWVKAQPGFVDGRGLAVSGEPRYALAMHLDSEGGEHVFLHSDIGPGLLLVPIPLGVWPGWEYTGDYNTRAGMLGHPDPVYSAKRLFEERQAAWAAHGLAYSLVGIATSYQIPEPESARRAVQPLNDALKGSRGRSPLHRGGGRPARGAGGRDRAPAPVHRPRALYSAGEDLRHPLGPPRA
ncbi:hypothetical protein [Segniliparus rugosus]|uniref:Uncharacterized protein n=1 Tax=Segniliparus rugosus (strain ATCC BAA-974 / DSM 45345 / CCUG 50838 / CIP 108380 / JCM 13579 / CDC 945) TaxID=679197 RepID=E5XMS9_SEGRC|nr:hypothetical protein [Segniliparus rugosus]EFV14349.1 hypothetical protein HMPREF9336_00799 [Segniliparus rugosus ATCC BAA-974]